MLLWKLFFHMDRCKTQINMTWRHVTVHMLNWKLVFIINLVVKSQLSNRQMISTYVAHSSYMPSQSRVGPPNVSLLWKYSAISFRFPVWDTQEIRKQSNLWRSINKLKRSMQQYENTEPSVIYNFETTE